VVARPVDEFAELEKAAAQLDQDIRALTRARGDCELVAKEAAVDEFGADADARQAQGKIIASAINLVMSGVTLPSLYTAVCAAVNGPMAGDEDRHVARLIMKLVIEGLRERKFPVHKMGFKNTVGANAMEELTNEDLMRMCETVLHQMDTYKEPKLAAFGTHQDPLHPSKVAAYFQHDHKGRAPSGKQPFEDAATWLTERPSAQDPNLPMDPDWASNTPGGKIRVLDGNSEFIVGVKDLISARERKLKLHDSQEYIGLRMKQIDEGIRALVEKRASVEQRKAAIAGIGTAAKALIKAIPAAVKASPGQAISDAANLVGGVGGIANAGAAGAGLATTALQTAVPSADARLQARENKRNAAPAGV
jgi:hypothetical protein